MEQKKGVTSDQVQRLFEGLFPEGDSSQVQTEELLEAAYRDRREVSPELETILAETAKRRLSVKELLFLLHRIAKAKKRRSHLDTQNFKDTQQFTEED